MKYGKPEIGDKKINDVMAELGIEQNDNVKEIFYEKTKHIGLPINVNGNARDSHLFFEGLTDEKQEIELIYSETKDGILYRTYRNNDFAVQFRSKESKEWTVRFFVIDNNKMIEIHI